MDKLRMSLWSFLFIPLFFITGFYALTALPKGRKRETSTDNIVSPIRTLFTTLSSTIGTGNIVGVSLALQAGGAGSIFWMWVAAAVGMIVSYTENTLGALTRFENDYPIPYMGKYAAVIFSVCCVFSSLGMGNMAQANSAAQAAYSSFNMPHFVTGAVMMIVCGIIILRGLSGILKFTEKFVPIMTVLYITSAIAVIYINRSALDDVLHDIFSQALSIKAIFGGCAATGITRGVFSGEAGLGSVVILSSKSNADNARTQGFVGMSAIFCDTFIICTLTALCILTAKSASAGGAFYATAGRYGENLLNLSLVFFAFSTIIAWSYNGEVCIKFIFGDRFSMVYKLLFSLCVFVGAVVKMEIVWQMSDIFNVLMAVPNLISIIIFLHKSKR